MAEEGGFYFPYYFIAFAMHTLNANLSLMYM
ncbi:Uncharacterised protein [Capnocytophaga canimorsus]|nr:hypothetical protein CLV61_1097 [Capnocytophaga canimorsus]STA72915.1 Uncharacterised protein [Capnocytophaga canimorsus]